MDYIDLSVSTAGVTATASALELQMSGFGTAGVAVSDQSYRYQRFIDSDGTVKRDSVFGAQADLKLTTELSVTVQAKVAPADDSDDHWKGSLAWAFASWRPNNEWLVRLGKVRLPMMAVFVGNVVNLLLNWLFIHDTLNIGIDGAVGSATAYAVAAGLADGKDGPVSAGQTRAVMTPAVPMRAI